MCFSGGCNLQVAGCRSEFVIWQKVSLEVSCLNILPIREKKAAYLESATPDIDRLVMLFVTIIICNNVWHYGNRFMEMILTKEEVGECSIYRLWKQSTLKEHRKMLGKRKSQWSSKKKKKFRRRQFRSKEHQKKVVGTLSFYWDHKNPVAGWKLFRKLFSLFLLFYT